MKAKQKTKLVICYEYNRDTTPVDKQIAKIKDWANYGVKYGKLNISFTLGEIKVNDTIAEFSLFINKEEEKGIINYFLSVIGYEFIYYCYPVELKQAKKE